MFVGIFFLLFGLTILIKVFFKIEIPLFRLVGGFFLVYLGFKILFGSFETSHGKWARENTLIFSDDEFKSAAAEPGKSTTYNVVFGRGVIDLTKISPKPGATVEINTVFGEGIVLYDPKVPLRVRANAVFSDTQLPNGNRVNFGNLSYDSPVGDTSPLHVFGSSVFGSLRFEAKPSTAG